MVDYLLLGYCETRILWKLSFQHAWVMLCITQTSQRDTQRLECQGESWEWGLVNHFQFLDDAISWDYQKI